MIGASSKCRAVKKSEWILLDGNRKFLTPPKKKKLHGLESHRRFCFYIVYEDFFFSILFWGLPVDDLILTTLLLMIH